MVSSAGIGYNPLQELNHSSYEGKALLMNATITRTPLTVSDRCDRCGAQAFVRVYLGEGNALQFCAHHFHEHEGKLRDIALDIQDESSELS